jgi:external thioesterase TEII
MRIILDFSALVSNKPDREERMICMIKQLKSAVGLKQLFCFPFAGGYSASYRPLSQAFESNWGLAAIEPPGHGTNFSPLVSDINQLVNLYEQMLLPKLNQPFALFGHSMGGIIVYELSHRLERQGVYPEIIFISGVNPPHFGAAKISHLDDDQLLNYINSLGGISEELLQEKELLELFLPILRNDLIAIENHEYETSRIIETPVHFFSGKEDQIATPQKMEEWEKYFKSSTFHTFGGNHMFILTKTFEVAERIKKLLA